MENGVILIKFLSLAAQKFLNTSSVAYDENCIKIIFPFQCIEFIVKELYITEAFENEKNLID